MKWSSELLNDEKRNAMSGIKTDAKDDNSIAEDTGRAVENCLYIVVPCYNEQEILADTHRQISEKLGAMIHCGSVSAASRILFINDGSKDKTWEIIKSLHTGDPLVEGITLSRNRGHQNALLAGLLYAGEKADMVISIDADLQDDINAIDEMVVKYCEGCDIVYGVRTGRKEDSFFKRFTAEAFYRFMNVLGTQTVFNHADYRLMSRRAIKALAQFREVNLFLRGIIPMLGFRTDTVFYERRARTAGESKYPLKKMFALAIEGITSFSIRPIRVITLLGIIVFLVSIIMLIYALVSYFSGVAVAGWSSLLVSLWAIGGLLLLAIGIVGEYIGKIYMESKSRPRYIIEEELKR